MITVADWKLAYEGFAPNEEGLREALCTLGNGYFATRGAAEEAVADDVHYPGTYLGGGYNRLETTIAGRVIENEDLVNLPNWLPLTFRPVDGDWLNLHRDEVVAYRQELDLQRGLLTRRFQVRDKSGRETSIESRRLVHMRHRHLAAVEMKVRPLNWSGEIEVLSALDGRVVNAGVARYDPLNNKHLEPLDAKIIGDESMLLVVETNQSLLRIAEAARTLLINQGEILPTTWQTRVEDGYTEQRAVIPLAEGETLTVEKVVALHCGRDKAVSEPALAAQETIRSADSFDALLEDHELAWSLLWQRCDIKLTDSHRPQMILRLHIFHLLQSVSLHSYDLDVGVPARGLHGEAYRGHIFWDEIFILPFLNFRMPEISRALLLYRYRRLPAARAAARESGLVGALFPWQSGSSGREESQVLHLNPRSGRWTPDNTYLQRHVNGAIAINIWRYYETTGDAAFLASYGAEVFVEIARLWASLARWNEAKKRYDIANVVGPDEFHDAYPGRDAPGLDNNAYTNVLAAWVLMKAQQVLEVISAERRRELAALLRLKDEEQANWEDISRKLFVPFHDGVISQFEGYEGLEELDWNGYRAKYDDIQRLDRILEAEGDTVNRYKASKQADVLMLFYLFSFDELGQVFHRLGYAFDAETVDKCIAYYLPRTSNGSTLSRIVHSWVLARRDRAQSWQLLKEALESDISDVQGGTTAEGIHLGAMAGTVDLVQRGQTALEIADDILTLNPCVPEEVRNIEMRLVFRGARIHAEVGCDRVVLSAPESWTAPNKIGLGGRVHPFRGGDRLEFATQLKGGGWRPITQRVTRRRQAEATAKVADTGKGGRRRRAAKTAPRGTDGG